MRIGDFFEAGARSQVTEVRHPALLLARVGKASVQDAVVEDQAIPRGHRLRDRLSRGVFRQPGLTQRRWRDFLRLGLIQEAVAVQPRALQMVRQQVRAARHLGRASRQRDVGQRHQHIHGVCGPRFRRLVRRVDVPLLRGGAGPREDDPAKGRPGIGPKHGANQPQPRYVGRHRALGTPDRHQVLFMHRDIKPSRGALDQLVIAVPAADADRPVAERCHHARGLRAHHAIDDAKQRLRHQATDQGDTFRGELLGAEWQVHPVVPGDSRASVIQQAPGPVSVALPRSQP
jgi:hypothetical protein